MLKNFSKTNHPVSSGTRTLPNSNLILFPLDLDVNFAIRPQENTRTGVFLWPPAVHLPSLARQERVASPAGKGANTIAGRWGRNAVCSQLLVSETS